MSVDQADIDQRIWDRMQEEAEQYEARKDAYVKEYVKDAMRSRSADDLRLAFLEDADNPENITRAMRTDDKIYFYDECMKALETYLMRNAEIEWEAKHG